MVVVVVVAAAQVRWRLAAIESSGPLELQLPVAATNGVAHLLSCSISATRFKPKVACRFGGSNSIRSSGQLQAVVVLVAVDVVVVAVIA